VVLSANHVLGPDVLPEQVILKGGPSSHRFPEENHEGHSLFEIVESHERRIILDVLSRSNWSQTEAAEKLRVPLSTLNQKIKRLNIEIRKKSELARSEKGG